MFERLWKASAPLTATGVLMLPVLLAAIMGLVLDSREVGGAPVWLKPAKFAVSIAVYSFTLAWIYTLLPRFGKTGRTVAWMTAVAMVVEMGIITVQAWRGTTSHFNVGTGADTAMFAAMGGTIVTQTVASVWIAVALWRERFADASLGMALRVGMTVTIIGASTGGLMTAPTAEQLANAHGGARLTVVGAHTVGAPDGSPGLPGTGWSSGHGDLRVPHFVGLHGVQVLPLLALWLRRRRVGEGARVRLMATSSVSYFALFVLLLVEAYRGQSVVGPDAATLALFFVWGVATVVFGWVSVARGSHSMAGATV